MCKLVFSIAASLGKECLSLKLFSVAVIIVFYLAGHVSIIAAKYGWIATADTLSSES